MFADVIDCDLLCREADRVAARVARRIRLSAADREDLRQDLLADLLARLVHFDPDRGTLAAFIAVVLLHGTTRLIARVRHHRRFMADVSFG